MNKTTLPPSPNWYLSNIFACSFNGTVAWGARCGIVIAKPNKTDKTLQYSIIKHTHKTKVTCIAFTPQFEEVNSNLLASTGHDNLIKIWNAETLKAVHIHPLESGTHPVAVDWACEKHVLYSITSDGYVLSWNIYFNTVSLISLGKVTPTCISSCPHDPNLVAAGSKSGLVYIINFQGKGNIVYKLRGHNTEVISLSWCPSKNNVLNGNTNRDLLLASGGKDRSIFIWKAGGDGRCDMKISVPVGPLDSRQHRSKLNPSVGNWIVVNWLEPKLLLASSLWGELMSWDLSTMTKGKPTWKLVHAYHNRGLFCVAHALNMEKTLVPDWRVKQRHQIWTLAQDRRVICCGIQENNVEIDYDIFTQGSYVYCIAACPLDTSNIAFGVGDGMLRLWNLSEPHSTTFDIVTLWQKINGKIRTISWHPEKENLLAYATEEGQVGVFNTNGNKPPILFKQYHRSIVYTIGWGPNTENRHVLYSCGEGELVYYDLEKPDQDPISVLKKECTDFSWKEDFSCLAVGFENGSISFLNRKFETCGYAKITSKMIYCLAWHPESTATDTTFSPLKNYLAVTSRSSPIYILDLSNFMDHLTKLETLTNNENLNEKFDPYNVHEVVVTLAGNIHSVVCLAWSPYISPHLIAGSYDGIAQIWHVERQELIATYTEHSGPVMCCMWSPLDPNYIITGSADCTVRIWKIGDNLTQENIQTNVSKKSNKKQQSKANNVADISIENTVTDVADTMPERPTSNMPQVVQESEKTLINVSKKKKSGRKPYFIKRDMTDKTLLLKSLLSIVKNIKDENKTEESQDPANNLATVLFSTKENLMSFLIREKSRHMENNEHNHVAEMDIWCDNLEQNLEKAAKEHRLNDFLVSLSASLSIKMWKKMCERYAYQLKNQGNPYKAVSYFLCINKIYKAMEIYESADLYEEAYVLARCKLEPDDPILIHILYGWAAYSVRTGNFEQAAYVYTKLGEFDNAVKYLARCKHIEALTTAAEIALLCIDDNTGKRLSEQAILMAFKNSRYDTARDIIVKFPYLKYQEIYLLTLEELDKVMEKNVNLNTIEIWLNGQSNYGLLQALELVSEDYGNKCTELHQTNVSNNLENERMLWLTVGYNLAVAIVSADKEQKLKHIVTALHTINQYETMHRNVFENQCSFLVEILVKLDTKSLTDKDSIYAKTDCSISASLRAYLCYALLDWFVCNVYQESVNNNIETYIALIENLLEDALNERTIKYWTITNAINKLEGEVISAMSKTTSEENTNDKHAEALVEEINALKVQWKQYLNDLVYVPNPDMIYCKANELCNKLLDESIKNQFSEIISRTWTSATT